MTKGEAKKRMMAIREELAALKKLEKTDPEVRRLTAELNKAVGRVQRQNEAKERELDAEMIKVEAVILDSATTHPDLSDTASAKIKKWMDGFCRKYEGARRWQVIWVSPSERTAILRFPGRTGWAGRGNTKYYPTKYQAMRTSVSDIFDGNLYEYIGRLGTFAFDTLVDKALDYEKEFTED